MIEKIKVAGEAAKNLILYILTPLAFMVGFIWYLVTQNRDLKDELKAKDGSEKLNELEGEKSKIDESASGIFKYYEQLRKAYLGKRGDVRSGSESGGQGDQDSGGTDKDKG